MKQRTPATTQVIPDAKVFKDDPSLKAMVKDEFLSAKELMLTEDQRAALIATLKLMDEGKLIHVSSKDEIDETRDSGLNPFHMRVWGGYCGSICCIGGTASWVLGRRVFMDVPRLSKLFFGVGIHINANVQESAAVVRNYLKTGKTDWGIVERMRRGK